MSRESCKCNCHIHGAPSRPGEGGIYDGDKLVGYCRRCSHICPPAGSLITTERSMRNLANQVANLQGAQAYIHGAVQQHEYRLNANDERVDALEDRIADAVTDEESKPMTCPECGSKEVIVYGDKALSFECVNCQTEWCVDND